MAEENPPRAPGSAALVLLDILNPLDFPGASALRDAAVGLVDPLLRLRDIADGVGVPVVYVNDNHGAWHAERSALVDAVRDSPGAILATMLAPRDHDFFVIKPQFSGFYATTLSALLPRLGVDRLILTGIAADICVLFTAADAHMREYKLWVPRDAVAGEDADRTHWALGIMKKAMGAETRPTDTLSLAAWLAGQSA
ncbi:MAG: cysteine hydrolase family protein [Sphingomonas sp.]